MTLLNGCIESGKQTCTAVAVVRATGTSFGLCGGSALLHSADSEVSGCAYELVGAALV